MYFNPRTPCGVRQESVQDSIESQIFQSTHPMRGATFRDRSLVRIIFISIHAPHAGCDVAQGLRDRVRHDFNPRTPCGVRLSPRMAERSTWKFQSTHPMRGATAGIKQAARSIENFNPRTPCGVRRRASSRRTWDAHFNPRTPCGVRHNIASAYVTTTKFQSTHPMRGATARAGSMVSHQKHFNPRTPCGVRHGLGLHDGRGRIISIHAPHAGCDTAKGRRSHN